MSLLAFHRVFIAAAFLMVAVLLGWSIRQAEPVLVLSSGLAMLLLLVYGWRNFVGRQVSP